MGHALEQQLEKLMLASGKLINTGTSAAPAAPIAWGTSVPADLVGGYAVGAIFIHSGGLFVNVGSVADALFYPAEVMGLGSTYHMFFDDFYKFALTDWTNYVLEAGAGAASEAVGDAVNGILTITNDDADDDCDQIVWPNETFKIAENKRLWFEAKLTYSEATECDWAVGLIADEDLTAVADNRPAEGIIFYKDDGDTQLDFGHTAGGSDTQSANIATADTSAHTYGFYYDGGASGAAKLTPYVDGVAKTGLATVTFTTAELSPMFLIRNGDANGRNVQIDYVKVVQLK